MITKITNGRVLVDEVFLDTDLYLAGKTIVGIGSEHAFDTVVDAAGQVIKEAPLGIEWMLESAINPTAMCAGVDNGVTSNLLWEFDHRGACCPDMNGIGLDASDYTAYMARLNQKEN